MKEFWNSIQFVFTSIGGWLGWFLGCCDGLMIALIIFVVADYITGVMCAVSDKKLDSKVGFKGICRKMLIFVLVRWYSASRAARTSHGKSYNIRIRNERGRKIPALIADLSR